jgi:glycerol uptake facilitator protein
MSEKAGTDQTPSLRGQCLAEYVGTFIVILVGDGAVATAVMTSALDGWGVAMMWGFGVTLAIYVAAPVSGAHFNPAVTLSMALFRGFPAGRVLPYFVSQLAGAFTGAAAVYAMWAGHWQPAIEKMGIEVGAPGSQKLMSIFSCFYPSPGVGVDAAAMSTVSLGGAFFVEVLITGFLLLAIFSLTEPSSTALPQSGTGPLFVGFIVAVSVGLAGQLTMDAINPVRDLGPRLFGWVLGFGSIAFPGPRGNEWWLYITAPLVGGVTGASVYQLFIRRFLIRAGAQ